MRWDNVSRQTVSNGGQAIEAASWALSWLEALEETNLWLLDHEQMRSCQMAQGNIRAVLSWLKKEYLGEQHRGAQRRNYRKRTKHA